MGKIIYKERVKGENMAWKDDLEIWQDTPQDFSEYPLYRFTEKPDYSRSGYEKKYPNRPMFDEALYNFMPEDEEMGEQKDIWKSTDFIKLILEHFRDKGMGTNLGLKKGSGLDPATPQSETFLRLLTTPNIAKDVFFKDTDIRDRLRSGIGRVDTETLKKQQDALLVASDALLNTNYKSRTGKYPYEPSTKGTWKDKDVLDVIKALSGEF